MTFAQCLAWISTNIIYPIFNFNMPFWGGVTFGAVAVAAFGLPILVRAYRQLF